MVTLVAIVNVLFAVVIFGIIFTIMDVSSKYDWAFGDDAKREVLSFKFMRLLVAAIVLGLIAAFLNIFVI